MVPLRRSLWQEPRPADAPPPGGADRLLVGVFAAAALAEGMLRPELVWRPLTTALAMVLVPALLWRRSRPLATTLLGWAVPAVLSVCRLVADTGDVGLDSMMVVLVLLFSLVRWGSGREIALGAAYVAGVVGLGMVAESATGAELFGGSVLVLLVAALGAAVRYRADLWQRQQREIRNDERMALARELHDTVAHHVSAIAVQAQAGGVVAGLQPERAVEVLAAIESEASRTLTEMRSMVRVLREEDGQVPQTPQRGLADLGDLARTGPAPAVEVAVDGSLVGPAARGGLGLSDGASPVADPVGAAVYRIAQEAVTNAVRHARGATRVVIEVRREGDVVRLRVGDDGAGAPGRSGEPGFGLRGMAERAQLLGGSLSAGPSASGGWVVEAVLPVGGTP